MKIKYYLTFLIVLLFIFGCEQVSEQPLVEEEKGTGILVMESVPADADLFINNANKGKTPLTLYNFDVGSYNIIIKKEGYEDYESVIEIEAGRKTEIRAYLELKNEVVEEEVTEEEVEVKEEEKEEEEILVGGIKDKGIIDMSDGLIKYYDFSEKYFSAKLQAGLDVFSRRYPTHFVFTRYNPVNIAVIEKNIDEVKKEDCENILGSLGLLSSGKTLCVNTKEGYIVAIGGSLEETEGSTLTWKLFD